VRFKLNSLVDEGIIDALYDASAAGVPVDLWIRGICCLRPGVPELSENIRVRSTLGRFLEHSRILAFQNVDDPEYWIGSADLMHRNLERRVETMVRLGSKAHETQLRALFDLAFDDRVASWHLLPDSTWIRVHKDEQGEPLADLQEILITQKSRRKAAA
jgi:polyphosphate kinase